MYEKPLFSMSHPDILNRAALVYNIFSKTKETSLLCQASTECWCVWHSLIEYRKAEESVRQGDCSSLQTEPQGVQMGIDGEEDRLH